MFHRNMGLLTLYAAFPTLCQRQLKPSSFQQPLLLKPYCFNQSQSAAMNSPLEESDVGISFYISPLPGFRGILKQRYCDFVVNEVDLDGNVVHLTSLDAPAEPTEEHKTKMPDQLKGDQGAEIELFRDLVGDSDANSLKEFIDKINSDVEDGATSIVLSPSSDKVHRTAVHNFFKERLKFLVTDTVDGPDPSSKCIRVRLNSGEDNGRGQGSKKRKGRGETPYDSRGSDHWPEHLGKFLRFHLCKENKDTQEALGVIGKMLGIQVYTLDNIHILQLLFLIPHGHDFGESSIPFTYDSSLLSLCYLTWYLRKHENRCITASVLANGCMGQNISLVTVFKQRANKVASLNKRLIGIKIGDFCYVNEGLLLGQLHGNRFTITLRGVVADSEDTVKAAADALGKHGFINYFGMQVPLRSTPEHPFLDLALVLCLLTLLVLNYFEENGKPQSAFWTQKDDIRRIRDYYKESEDIDETLRQLPRYLVAERAILQCLKKCPGNYLQALKAVPRTLRMMYVHSYQSYLWNHAASMRVQKYGTDKVVVGDLVYCNEESSNEIKQVHDSDYEDIGHNDSSENNHLDEADPLSSEGSSSSVKVINDEDILSGNYTVTDVVLPLPGSRVIYPQNDIEQYYQDLADKDGVSLTECLHNVK
ncbi:Pseudouridine synthase, catalytic domain-containing protein [Cynara cardunculus var. scolymus]|uniref:Pseudouridine synthase, catalytic domain-containing protein n=1 Tax=Cynara cardunculus var. scolymus TaxID=59895 RepID=A0A103XCF3_CYNCS|nr:Pseudouridine synthase, catalytic domain-containing protein [Cynara cardunculus var. scolymus]